MSSGSSEPATEIPISYEELIQLHHRMQTLAGKLQAGLRIYDGQPGISLLGGGDNRWRNGAAAQLAAVLEFVKAWPGLNIGGRSTPNGHRLTPPLSDLLKALAELDQGFVAVIIQQIPPGRGGAKSMRRDQIIAWVLLLADMVGAADAAARLNKAGYLSTKGQMTSETIREWQKGMEPGRRALRRGHPRRKAYEELSALKDKLTPEGLVEMLLAKYHPGSF